MTINSSSRLDMASEWHPPSRRRKDSVSESIAGMARGKDRSKSDPPIMMAGYADSGDNSSDGMGAMSSQGRRIPFHSCMAYRNFRARPSRSKPIIAPPVYGGRMALCDESVWGCRLPSGAACWHAKRGWS